MHTIIVYQLFPVEYTRGESPHVLETGTYGQTANPPRIALSPNAEVLAVSVDSSVEFYDTYTGKLYDTVENVYSGKFVFICSVYRKYRNLAWSFGIIVTESTLINRK